MDRRQQKVAFRFGSLEKASILAYLIGLVWRVWYIFFFCIPTRFMFSDMGLYLDRAKEFAQPDFVPYRQFVTHPPGMIFLLSKLYQWDPTWELLKPIQFFLSALIPLEVAALAFLLSTPRVAAMAFLISSLYFPYIDYGGYALSEIYVTPVFLLFCLLFLMGIRSSRPRWYFSSAILCGAICSLLGVFKSYFLLCGVFIALHYFVFGQLQKRANRLLFCVLFAGSQLPLIAMMTSYCSKAAGEFCVGAAKMGSDFLLGHYGRGGTFRWVDRETNYIGEFGTAGAEQRGLNENYEFDFSMSNSKANMSKAMEWVSEHPSQAFIQSIEHIDNAFFATYPWPTISTPHRVASEASQLFFIFFLFLPAVLFLRDIRVEKGLKGLLQSDEALLLSTVLALMLAMMIGTGEVRYRVPFDAFFIVFAAALYCKSFRLLSEEKEVQP